MNTLTKLAINKKISAIFADGTSKMNLAYPVRCQSRSRVRPVAAVEFAIDLVAQQILCGHGIGLRLREFLQNRIRLNGRKCVFVPVLRDRLGRSRGIDMHLACGMFARCHFD
jgi:hypothetical protein